MDFTFTQDYGGGAKNRSNHNSNVASEFLDESNEYDLNYVSIMNRVSENQDLIQDYLANQKDHVLPTNELKKYGSLALTSAALECKDDKEYRSFAKKRVENMMKRAIAEAHLILELQEKICDNNQLGMEFASIEKTYC